MPQLDVVLRAQRAPAIVHLPEAADAPPRHQSTPAIHRIALLFRSLPVLVACRFAVLYVIKSLFNRHAAINYSQTGEDAIIRSLLDENCPGVFVDVGCNHPVRLSNTLSLYLHGWRGINVDANPRLIAQFRKTRLRDVAVCAAVSDVEQDVVFHEFEDDLVSTLGNEVLPQWESRWKKSSERTVRTRTLDSILDEHLPPGTPIDLLSVDVEGHDLNVLRSVNLDVHRPRLILVEVHGFDLRNAAENAVVRHLDQNGFRLIGFDTLNAYFVDRRSPMSGPHLAG